MFGAQDPDHVVTWSPELGMKVTKDGGITWAAGHGLDRFPEADIFELAVSPADSQVIWALGQTKVMFSVRLFRSVDGGITFDELDPATYGIELHTGCRLAPHPSDPAVLYLFERQRLIRYNAAGVGGGNGAPPRKASETSVEGTVNSIAFARWGTDLIYLGLDSRHVYH